MPGHLSTNRKLVLISIGIAALLSAAILVVGGSESGEASSVPSTYSSASGGARAAFLLLERLQFPVRRWEDSPVRLPPPDENSLLVLAEPAGEPSAGERAAVEKFVKAGGRLLFCGGEIEKFFPQIKVRDYGIPLGWDEPTAQLPSWFTRNAPRITMEDKGDWEKLQGSQLALYRNAKGPVVVAARMGAGELLWWAASTPLTNAGIVKEGNLALFLNAVSQLDGSPMTVYWDEYFHGERASFWSYVEHTPVKWAFWQALFFWALVLFAYSRRWGPVLMPRQVSRLSPLEFVNALGGLYEKAGVTGVPVSVAYRRLRGAMAGKLMLPASVSNFDLAEAAGMRLGFDRGQLADLLDRAEDAAAQKVTAAQALKIVQDLDEGLIRMEKK